MKRYLFGVAAAVLGTALVGLTGLHTAAAADPPPTTVTLPLFGAPLTIEITSGPGGNISNVAVDPADGTVATKLRPHKVVFQSANPADPTADPARIVIKSRHGGQSVSARAGSLADVSGPGGWSGDVFGDGTTSSVNFTVGAGSDGGPDITGITTSGASAVPGDVQRWTGDDHEGDHHDDGSSAGARVSIKFTNAAGDQSRSLTISVKVRTGEEHSGAKLSISLGRIKGVALDAAAQAGPHTWSGTLCDGSTASISYTVAADGTVSDVATTPDTATVHSDGGKIWVAFSDHEWVRVSVREHDGMIKISAVPMLMCKTDDPTTNVDVSIPVPDDSGDHHGDGDFGFGDHHEGFGGFDGSKSGSHSNGD